MPRLHYSNQLESLILPLAHELNKRDPIDCADIVVPNYSLEKWISLKLAQINGISANLRFITLEKAIYEGLKDKLKGRRFDLLKKETIQCLLVEILRKKQKSSDDLWLPVRNYLTPNFFLRPQAIEQRLYQLSKRLTYLFLEYEFSRNEELISSWIEGKNVFESDSNCLESWQKTLWIELFGSEGKVTKHNKNVRESMELESQPELFTLTQLYRICHSNSDFDNTKNFSQYKNTKRIPLHVFGISYLSQFHQRALTEQLSIIRDINVYSLNPCMEFWEDVQSLKETKTEILKSIESKFSSFKKQKTLSQQEILLGEISQIENDNPFLQAWGKPGRENIRLLNQWNNWDFTPWFVEKISTSIYSEKNNQSPSNILNQLQQDILFREPRRLNSLEMEQDESIMVLACSNPKREVEAVASLIWDLTINDPELMLNECALIVHDMKLYQHEIEQVFESTYNLPYHLVDGVSSLASRLEDASNLLLGLCFTDYTRRDLFNLINNPFFIRVFDDSTITDNVYIRDKLKIEKWLQWADDLNIFYGIDSEWLELQGYKHLEQDNFTWEHAFRRLTLGEMVAAKKSSDIFSLEDQQILPANLPQDFSKEAARFMLIIRSLISDTRDLPKWEMSAKDWGHYLNILIKTYLKPFSKDNEDAYQNLLKNALAIRDIDLGNEGKHLFGFNTIFEFFKQKQKTATLHRGHYLAEGITVSSFLPMRPIPFKSVFLLGLGEGLFPTTSQQDTLDLRYIPKQLNPAINGKYFRERQIGDVSETERDRYMFLETLISTKKNLVLSYVSRNEMTDDKLSPSSIIQTLVDELERGYLKKKFKETLHPLKNYSLSYFPELDETETKNTESSCKLPNYSFPAFNQAKSLRLRELFEIRFPGLQRIPTELLSPEIKKTFKNNLVPTKKDLKVIEKDFTCVSISSIRKFLESPLQSKVSQLIKFNDPEYNVSEKIEEPLILGKLNEWSLLKKVWNNALTSSKNNYAKSELGPEWQKSYRLFFQHMEQEGTMPSSIFKETMQQRHLKILNNWQKQLTAFLKINWSTLQKKLVQFHLGTLENEILDSGLEGNHVIRPAAYIKNIENFSSKLNNFSTKLQGSTEWWYNDKKNWYVIYLSEKESKEKTWLRHFLNVLILSLADLFPKNANVEALCISSDGKVKNRKVKIPCKIQTQEYLSNLIQDINNENVIEFFPIESVFELSKENLNESDFNKRFVEWMDEKMNSPRNNLDISSKFGPINFLEDIPYPGNPYQIMNRRFKLFFETILD